MFSCACSESIRSLCQQLQTCDSCTLTAPPCCRTRIERAMASTSCGRGCGDLLMDLLGSCRMSCRWRCMLCVYAVWDLLLCAPGVLSRVSRAVLGDNSGAARRWCVACAVPPPPPQSTTAPAPATTPAVELLSRVCVVRFLLVLPGSVVLLRAFRCAGCWRSLLYFYLRTYVWATAY